LKAYYPRRRHWAILTQGSKAAGAHAAAALFPKLIGPTTLTDDETGHIAVGADSMDEAWRMPGAEAMGITSEAAVGSAACPVLRL